MPAQIILLVVGGILFYRIGDHEYGAGFVTAGLSILLGIITWLGLGGGGYGYLAGQLLLFGGLTWYNMKYRPPGKRG